MAVRLNPYLNFRDDARDAMTYYHSVLGGELTISTCMCVDRFGTSWMVNAGGQ